MTQEAWRSYEGRSRGEVDAAHVQGQDATATAAEAHLFKGFDVSPTSESSVTMQSRVTYPSDITLDSVNVTLGSRISFPCELVHVCRTKVRRSSN